MERASRSRGWTRRDTAVVAAAAVVYALSVWFERYGLASSQHGTDVAVYAADAQAIARGSIPYRDLYFEYPPGALAPLLAAEPAADYATAFKWLMAALGGGMLVVAAVVLRAQGRRLEWIGAIAIAPLAVGSVFLNRYDAWPALLTVAAIALLARGRPLSAFALLAVGADTKIFPAVVVPAAAVWLWRRQGAAAAKRALVTFLAVAVGLLLPFAALGPGGVRFSFTIQATRHLQTESLAGAILLCLDRAGAYTAHIATGKPGSLDVFGALPSAAAALSVLLAVAGIAWTAFAVRRGPASVERLVQAAAAAVAVYVAFGKVLSPQYVIWLVPLVPLAGGRRGRLATPLLLLALVLTQIEFDHHYRGLSRVGGVVWVLLARDLVLVAAALVLAWELAQRSEPHVEAARARAGVSAAPQ